MQGHCESHDWRSKKDEEIVKFLEHKKVCLDCQTKNDEIIRLSQAHVDAIAKKDTEINDLNQAHITGIDELNQAHIEAIAVKNNEINDLNQNYSEAIAQKEKLEVSQKFIIIVDKNQIAVE